MCKASWRDIYKRNKAVFETILERKNNAGFDRTTMQSMLLKNTENESRIQESERK